MTQYPARGLIFDRYGKLLVYNEAAYDLMVIPQQVKNVDTDELCRLLEIEKKDFVDRVEKARNYSPYRPSIFESQITRENYGYLEEKMFRFPGFFVQPRTLRKYTYPIAAHTMGYIGEAGPDIIESNSYYKAGDYIGISGLEKSYEEVLRGNANTEQQHNRVLCDPGRVHDTAGYLYRRRTERDQRQCNHDARLHVDAIRGK